MLPCESCTAVILVEWLEQSRSGEHSPVGRGVVGRGVVVVGAIVIGFVVVVAVIVVVGTTAPVDVEKPLVAIVVPAVVGDVAAEVSTLEEGCCVGVVAAVEVVSACVEVVATAVVDGAVPVDGTTVVDGIVAVGVAVPVGG